jgi:hypothetical protein
MHAALLEVGIQVEHLEPVEPTLEDVFLALADVDSADLSANHPRPL